MKNLAKIPALWENRFDIRDDSSNFGNFYHTLSLSRDNNLFVKNENREPPGMTNNGILCLRGECAPNDAYHAVFFHLCCKNFNK